MAPGATIPEASAAGGASSTRGDTFRHPAQAELNSKGQERDLSPDEMFAILQAVENRSSWTDGGLSF